MATCPVPASNDMLPESPGHCVNAAIQQVLSPSGTQQEGQSVSYTEYLSNQRTGENEEDGCNTATTSQSGSGSTTPSIPSYGDDIAAEIESSPSTTPRPGLTSTPRNLDSQAQRRAGSEISSIQSSLLPIGVGLSRRTSFDTASNISILSFDQSTTGATQTDTLINHDEIEVPVLSYEIMESQAKFTVFKLQVKKSEEEKWFIFRRYTDFVRLNKKLRCLFPHFRLALPPKKWFGDNYDSTFLEDRMLGLQAFLNNIVGHKDVCNSEPVRQFLCFDDPPGPHESLEESRAMCENLEDYSYNLRRELQERDAKIALMEEELALQRAEIDSLHTSLRLERSFHARRSSPGSQHSESSLPEQDQIPDDDRSSHHDCCQMGLSDSPDSHCSTSNTACMLPGSAPTISISSPLLGEQHAAAGN